MELMVVWLLLGAMTSLLVIAGAGHLALRSIKWYCHGVTSRRHSAPSSNEMMSRLTGR